MTVDYFTCSQICGRLALQNLLNGIHFGLIKLRMRKCLCVCFVAYKKLSGVKDWSQRLFSISY
jgi:hypothetical protein